jgi:hypothetical protein
MFRVFRAAAPYRAQSVTRLLAADRAYRLLATGSVAPVEVRQWHRH